MDFLESQIQLHSSIIEVHTKQLNYLKTLQNIQSADDVDDGVDTGLPVDLPDENYLGDTSNLERDQDLIWDRIKMAHPERYMDSPEKPPVYKENNLSTPIIKFEITNTQDIDKLPKKTQVVGDIKLQQPPDSGMETYSKFAPLVTRLSKFTHKKQDQIIKNIFAKARVNIEQLSKLDANIANNIDEEIQKEADRLLAAYLDNK